MSLDLWRRLRLENFMVRLLSADDLRARGVRLSKSQLYNLMKKGSFPRPIKVGGRSVAWPEAEIEAWLQQRIDDRDEAVQ